MVSGQIEQLFQHPTNAFRGKPFWSWNGKLDQEELIRQIHVIKEMGFGGFFMHSRTGLATEYLGEEWFRLINVCAEEAEKLGLEAWLYDEDRWPSGTAGGLVTQDPRYRKRYIRLSVIPAESFQWDSGIFIAFACRLEGMAFYEANPLAEGELPAAGEGLSVLAFTIEEMETESFYNGYTYVDTLNREATDAFLELTHERYLRHSGRYFGGAIKGIFTDEPHRGTLFDGFGVRNRDAHWLAPWTPALFDTFLETYGYDLSEKLPELFLQPEGRTVSQVKWHYVELLQQLFLDNFAKPINAWCERNNLILTGHVLHEDSLTAQTAMCGSMMRFYEHMGYPGVDVLTEGNRAYWIVKQLTSAARQLGRQWLLSELYGCTGWQMPFEGHKAVGDWQALFGINVRCHHLSWYTMEGEAKRDYPASIFHQSAWWREYEAVETYFSRLGVVLSQGIPVCDVLVLNPVESVWCQVYPGWSRYLGPQSPDVQHLERMYADLFHWLAGAQIDFDYGDEEMMSRLARVEQDDEGRPLLKVGEAAYRTVVVAGMTTIRSATVQLLRQYAAAGGRVVFAGEPPAYVDARESGVAAILSQEAGAVRIPFAADAIIAACALQGDGRVTVTDAVTGERLEHIYCQARTDGDTCYVVLLNVNREAWYRSAIVKIEWSGAVQEWNCLTGERISVPGAVFGDGFVQIRTAFPPSGEKVYSIIRGSRDESSGMMLGHSTASIDSIGPDPTASSSFPDECADEAAVVLEGPFRYALSEPNVLVLDQAAYRNDDGEWQADTEILKVDRVVRKSFGLPYRSGDMIQPWYAGQQKFETKGKVALRFDFHMKDRPSGELSLVMERPERFDVRLNGGKVHVTGTDSWWVDRSMIRIPLEPESLREGINSLQLETMFHQGVELEAVYLVGSFGVTLEGSRKTLTSLPETLAVGDVTRQGLPFYSGAITYWLENADLSGVNDAVGDKVENAQLRGEWFVSFPSFEGACIQVSSAVGEGRLIGWQPYEANITRELEAGVPVEVRVTLTRRNTFGPLHLVSVYSPAYGPDLFLTEGDSFTDSYTLVPSGLTDAPRIVYRQF